MASQNSDIQILSLRGGMNDTDAPNALADDQAVQMDNVELFFSMMGERRNGCDPMDITASDLDDETIIAHLSQWFPLNDVLNPEFIAVSVTPTTSATMAKRTLGTWSEIVPGDAIDFTNNDIYNINTQSLNGKLFVAYHSNVDRLHLWDGTTLRRAGLPQPVAPTAADTAGGGAYAGVRYFRIRYITKAGTTVVNRSEPSLAVTFTPSGANVGATITRPVLLGESETHWELEASTDNILFYRIATTINATTTFADTTVLATGYSGQGPLSEAIGAYLTISSVKYLAVDGDRLLYAGHWTNATLMSQIGWTPVANDPGSGNEERAPIVTTAGVAINNTTNLDNFDGGPITGIAASTYGVWYAFKWDHIYMMQRTGDTLRSYDVITLSARQGAIPGSIVRGIDENGVACIYFLDPVFGPSRITAGGVEVIIGLRTTWGRVNLQATSVIACGCFYPYKQQVIWNVAVDGANSPNLGLKLQVSEVRRAFDTVAGAGATRGWTRTTGRITQAYCMSVFTELVSIGGVTSISERPFIGLTTPDFIQRCDVDSTDAGIAYVATIVTRPYFVTGLLNRWGIMRVALLAVANASASITVQLIRDFGVENSQSITKTLTPVGTETFVVEDFDNLAMSGGTAIQIKFTG